MRRPLFNFTSASLRVKEFSARWLKTSRTLKKEDLIIGKMMGP
jgi:hypothetical protein